MTSLVLRDPVKRKIGLFAGAVLRSLSDEKVTGGFLRKRAGELGAKSYIHFSADQSCLLWHSYDLSDEQAVKGVTQRHSLAAAFALYVKDIGNAILLYKVNANVSALVVVEAGCPTVDTLGQNEKNLSVARDYASGKNGPSDFAIFASDPGLHVLGFECQDIDADSLLANVSKKTLFRGVPINLPLAICVTLVACACAVAAFFYFQVYLPEKEQQAARDLAKKNDPMIAYRAALEASLPKLGWSSAAAKDLLSGLNKQAVMYIQGEGVGWILDLVLCDAAAAKCTYTFSRNGGTAAGLKSVFDGELVSSTVDGMIFQKPIAVVVSGLTFDALPSIASTGLANTSVWNLWINAGVVFTATPAVYGPFPKTPNVEKIDPALVAKSASIAVSLPFYLAPNLLEAPPVNVFWASIQINTGEGRNLQTTLNGFSYGK